MVVLNDKQQKAYDAIIKGNERIVVLTGSPGTGKSTLVDQIVKDYPGSVLLTATTNKAKEHLTKITGIKAYTTHSALGFRMLRNGLSEYLADCGEAREADLLIVDEYSMLPQQVYTKILDTSYRKILLVGDDKQLPTIGVSAKIQPDRLVTLTQQMRQKDNKHIAEFFESFRVAIENKKYLDVTKIKVPGIELYKDHKEFCKAYLACESNKRILAYSNRVIDSYNSNIKQGTRYSVGDLLVLDKPYYGAKNGDIVEVTNIEQKTGFQMLTTLFNDEVLPPFAVFKTKTAENNFINEFIASNPVTATDVWCVKDKIMHPKHLYASTVHKAQGQTIDEVFIDIRDIYAQMCRKPTRFNNYNRPISVQDYMKLVYVAMTRMVTRCHLFIGDKRDYKSLRKDIQCQSNKT